VPAHRKKIEKKCIKWLGGALKMKIKENWEVGIKITETAKKKSDAGNRKWSAILSEVQQRVSAIRHLTSYFGF
jgi:hypothetical protein